jgi:hypothetical protein
MRRVRTIALSLAVIGVLAAASTAAPVHAESHRPAAHRSAGTVDDVKAWTRKRWSEMKAKWSQEKAKWAACQKRSHAQKLRGRKSWSFMGSCMTS